MRYDIYNHKPGVEGASPLNAESPVNEISTRERLKKKAKVMLKYGEMIAQRAFSTTVQELNAGGNQRLATQLTNASNIGSSIVMAIASSGTSFIPEAINGVAQTVRITRENNRQNRVARFEQELAGAKVNFNQGRIFYD